MRVKIGILFLVEPVGGASLDGIGQELGDAAEAIAAASLVAWNSLAFAKNCVSLVDSAVVHVDGLEEHD